MGIFVFIYVRINIHRLFSNCIIFLYSTSIAVHDVPALIITALLVLKILKKIIRNMVGRYKTKYINSNIISWI